MVGGKAEVAGVGSTPVREPINHKESEASSSAEREAYARVGSLFDSVARRSTATYCILLAVLVL